jgi:hypothetical protein
MDTQTLLYIILIIIIICLFKNDFISLLNINQSKEPFFDVRSELIQAVSEKLLISPRRIINFRYTGNLAENQLSVDFGISARNSLEISEASNSELLDTINHLFDTNMFAIVYQDRIINLSSNGQVRENFNDNQKNATHQSSNNVKPKENFEQYYCNINNKFDNTNLLRVKHLIDAEYRNAPYDESLTRFISLDTENGKMKALNTTTSCQS